MENVFERVIALIGKTPEHPEFKQFVEEIGENPWVGPRVGGVYSFPAAGFSLTYDQVFTAVNFYLHSNGASERAGGTDNFPGGTRQDDPRAMLKNTEQSCGNFMSHHESYTISQRVLYFHFASDRKLQERTLCLQS